MTDELADYYRLVATLEAQLKNPGASSARDPLSLRRLLATLVGPRRRLRVLANVADACGGPACVGGALLTKLGALANHGDPTTAALVGALARIEPRAGLGIDARPEFLPLRSDGPGAVLELRASAASRRSRAVSLPGTMSETLAELRGLRATNRATHASLAGTVRRIQTQASELRAKLRESRRTPSLAEIVALNSLPPRPAPS